MVMMSALKAVYWAILSRHCLMTSFPLAFGAGGAGSSAWATRSGCRAAVCEICRPSAARFAGVGGAARVQAAPAVRLTTSAKLGKVFMLFGKRRFYQRIQFPNSETYCVKPNFRILTTVGS